VRAGTDDRGLSHGPGGYVTTMTDPTDSAPNGLPGGDRSAHVEAVQAVVDRITSWQDGATGDVVRAELVKALDEAGVSVPDSFVDEVVRRVGDEDSAHFDVEPLLQG